MAYRRRFVGFYNRHLCAPPGYLHQTATKETVKGVSVYAYEVEPGISTTTGFGSSMEEVLAELRKVRAEISLEDGCEVRTSAVYAYDLYRPDLDQLLSVLNGDADLGDLILRDKRLVFEVS